MEIKETITRECCQPKDLREYKGMSDVRSPKFCIHCGQIWVLERYMDAAGDMDDRNVKLVIKNI